MKTPEATTQLGVLNQLILMREYNKCFPYSGPRRHEDDSIDTFFSSLKSHNSNNAVEIIVFDNTLLADVYAIVSNSGLKIAKVLQDRFY